MTPSLVTFEPNVGRERVDEKNLREYSVLNYVRDALNGFLFGWARYFSYGTHRGAFRGIDYYVYERVRDFLARRHKIKGRGTNRFSYNVVYGERAVLRLERLPWSLAPCASR